MSFHHNHKHRGFFYAAAAAVLFGASTPAAKALLPQSSPWLTAGLLYLGSGIGLIILSILARLFGRAISRDDTLTKSDIPWIAGATIFGGILGPALLLTGLARTTAASASLLLNMESVLTTLFAWFIFKENFDKRIALGTIFILGGSVVLSWAGGFELQSLTGPLLILAACFCWAIDNNLTRKIAGNHPVQLVIIKSVVAGFTNMALALAAGALLPNISYIGTTAVVGLIGYGFSLVCFIFALRHIGTARTGAYFSLAPFVGSILSVVVLGEPITPNLVSAAALMAAGVWLHLTENHGHEHEHQDLEHAHEHEHDEHHQHEHDFENSQSKNGSHSHRHSHVRLRHTHAHFPDSHHQHVH